MTNAAALLALKAWGLWVRGDLTYYQIAVALGIAEKNPSTASGRARTKIQQGWKIVYEHPVTRWDGLYSKQYPWNGWEDARGARLSTVARKPTVPPPPEPTDLEILLLRIEEIEPDAIKAGYRYIADGLRNFRNAVIHTERQKAEKAKTG